jgi:hypothetical protein
MCAIDECPRMKLYCRRDGTDGCNGTERTWDTAGREERNSTRDDLRRDLPAIAIKLLARLLAN